MKVVGLTGGIGSGKSMVLDFFASKGIPCYESDHRARLLMQENPELISKIKAVFGEHLYKDQKLDRKALAELVFSDPKKLESLNTMVHPAVQKDFQLFLTQQQGPYVVKEAAILFETGAAALCDETILLTVPESVRIERVMERDGIPAEAVKARINNQWEDEKKIPLADHVIENIDRKTTLQKIEQIHRALIAKSQ